MGQAAAGSGGEAASSVGDLLHPCSGGGGVAEVTVGFGQVVERHLSQLLRQQTGVDDGGEPVGRAAAVFVLPTAERVE